ncbi:response regulator transcription factor [Dermacoccus sp. 147Ba]|uniref:response regulator transcription factor n=1 Tax=unclassified Dermacoccus TaxID=2643059 RepID=UPI0009E50511|nr:MULTISPECIES: response regulator transcription factor [unclassified Dermacoccus]RYI20608.1 response regulator transcription factor [Dermacoccus sp. 147Ba]
MAESPHLLLVADCDGVDDIIAGLSRFGYSASCSDTVTNLGAQLSSVDVVLVDTDLQEFDGLTLCREIRRSSTIPLIGFTQPAELSRVLALEAGCDDCMDKPYRARELASRVQALLRRTQKRSSPILIVGELTLIQALREVRMGDELVETTPKEFDLLFLLASEPDLVFTRGELMQRVWDYPDDAADLTPLASRTIDTHVSSLRKKIGSPDLILTVRGVGFRFNGGFSH